jgi:molybdate transport system substrate-binding protein
MALECFVFSGGAAQAVVSGVQAQFEAANGCRLHGRFGAVGTMRDLMLAGERCDVLVVTDASIAALARDGHVDGGSVAPLGAVATGIAVTRTSAANLPAAPVTDTPALRRLLEETTALYVPDLRQSTAGLHIAGMLGRLGLERALAGRIREFPNGAAAMRALADDDPVGAIGITQVTEILFAPGVALVGELPAEHALRTVYAAAVVRSSTQPALAARLVAALTGADSLGLRERSGFIATPAQA